MSSAPLPPPAARGFRRGMVVTATASRSGPLDLHHDVDGRLACGVLPAASTPFAAEALVDHAPASFALVRDSTQRRGETNGCAQEGPRCLQEGLARGCEGRLLMVCVLCCNLRDDRP